MRKNRVLIQWNESDKTKQIKQDEIDSFKCNSLEAATRLVRRRMRKNIKKAVFIDNFYEEHIITNV